jgi:hypothetical protein
MAQEQESNWQAFHESLNRDLTSEWESMSVAPYQENRAWTSVFLMKETAGVFDMRMRHFASTHSLTRFRSATSITKALLELNRLEHQQNPTDSEQEQGITAPSWVSKGIDLEYQQ